MRTRSRRRLGWAAAGVLAAAAGAPELARAQQSGLFPLAPIRRERVPCPMEDPVYRMYRNQFFGYHPTCWRRFPSGWGCPSPEAPNAAESFRVLPRDKPPADTGPEAMPGPEGDVNPPAGPGPNGRPGRGAAPAPGTPDSNALPPLPRGTSPFELDNPSKPPTERPGDATPQPKPPAGNTPSPRRGDVDNPGAGAAVTPAPGLPPVAEPATAAPGAAAAASEPATAAPAAAEPPLLALPDPTAAAPVPGGNQAQTVPATPPPGGPMLDNSAFAPTGPALAPQRTSLIGNFFSGRLFRRR